MRVLQTLALPLGYGTLSALAPLFEKERAAHFILQGTQASRQVEKDVWEKSLRIPVSYAETPRQTDGGALAYVSIKRVISKEWKWMHAENSPRR